MIYVIRMITMISGSALLCLNYDVTDERIAMMKTSPIMAIILIT